jgi:hypothetical protein
MVFQSSFARALPLLPPLVCLASASPAHAQEWQRQEHRIVNKSGHVWSFMMGDCARPHHDNLIAGFAPLDESAGGESKITGVDDKSAITIGPGKTLQLYLKRLAPGAGGWMDLEFTREDSKRATWSVLLQVNRETAEVNFDLDWLDCKKAEELQYLLEPDLIEFRGAGASLEAGSRSGSGSEDDLSPSLAASLAGFATPERKVPAQRGGATHVPSYSPGSGYSSEHPSPAGGSPEHSGHGSPGSGGSPEHSGHGSPGSGGSPEHGGHGSPGSGSPGQSQDGSPELQSPGHSRPPTPPLAAPPGNGPALPASAAPADGAGAPAAGM